MEAEKNAQTSEFSSLTEKEREEMRKELSSYLLECRLDSEGKPLVHVPPNFQQVVEAMNRDDLFSVEEKPWSKYLLQSSLSSDKLFAGDIESSSRYKDVINEDEPDRKIKKGLAEIHMLDRQLQDVSQREKRSTSSKVATDRTFLTKALQDSDSISEPAISARQRPEKSSTQQSDILAKKSSAPASADPKPKTFGLSAEEELRVQKLMEEGEGEDETYGLAEYKEKNEEIDTLLLQFGRLDRLKSSGGEKVVFVRRKRNLVNNPRPEEEEGETEKKDYLTEQRQDRLQKESLRKVDKMLRACTQQRTQFDGLLGLAVDDSCRGSSVSTLVDKVPQFDEVDLEKNITSGDIAALIRSIMESNEVVESVVVDTAVPTPEQIHALLDRYKADISDLKAKRDAVQNRAYMQQLQERPGPFPNVYGEILQKTSSSMQEEDDEERSYGELAKERWLSDDYPTALNNMADQNQPQQKSPPKEKYYSMRGDNLSGETAATFLSTQQQQKVEEILSQVRPRQVDSVVPDAPSTLNPTTSSLPPLPSTTLLSQRTSSRSDGRGDLLSGEGSRPKSKDGRPDLRSSAPAPVTVFRATYKKDNNNIASRNVNVTENNMKMRNMNSANNNAAALSAAMLGSQPRYGSNNIDSAAAAVSALLKERQVQNILNKS